MGKCIWSRWYVKYRIIIFLTSTFLDLKLTGMQGDVMKESMTVSKTLAFSLINDELKESLINDFEKKNQNTYSCT